MSVSVHMEKVSSLNRNQFELHKKGCAHLLIEQPDSTRTDISLPKPRFQTYVMFVLTTTTTFSISNHRAELST